MERRRGLTFRREANPAMTGDNGTKAQRNENTMTTLKERLHGDVVTHMKERNKVALTTVRNVLGEIETREKSGKTPWNWTTPR